MFSKHERPAPIHNPSRNARNLPNRIDLIYDEPSHQNRPTTSGYQDCKVRAQQSVKEAKTPAEAKPASQPTQLLSRGTPGDVPGVFFIGKEYDDEAKKQAGNVINKNKTKKPGKSSLEAPENIELAPIGMGAVCAGDDQLQDIVVHASSNIDKAHDCHESHQVILSESVSTVPESSENTCWIFLPMCPGKKTICEWFSDAICYIVTCKPIRKFVKCCCLFGTVSDVSGNQSPAYEYEISQYIAQNPNFLIDYVTNTMTLEEIEQLYFKKVDLGQSGQSSGQNFEDLFKAGQMEFQSLFEDITYDTSQDELVFKLTEHISGAFSGKAFSLYKISRDGKKKNIEIYSKRQNDLTTCHWISAVNVDVQCLEALKRNSIMIFTRSSNPLVIKEFPHTVFERISFGNAKRKYDDILTQQILVPVFGEDSKVAYMMEIWRNVKFGKIDLEIARSCTVWGSIFLLYFDKWAKQRTEYKLNALLLESIQSIFEDVMSINQVVKNTLQNAQKLVDADRASLFMVDRENQELVSRVFDLRGDGSDSVAQPEEIRIPLARGIAGYVASTGETVNIANAYADERFNDKVDEATGYCTTSILCMPVKIDRKVIGVVQMVNKRSADCFSRDDESSFNIFSTFFGLALYNAGIYDTIARNEQKYRVALDVLSYHNTCREHEMQEFQKLQPFPPEVDLNDFYLDPFKFNPLEKCQAVMIMFNDLFNLKNFDHNSLTRFVLTVKKNYREVPYHNFHHGWSVAQSMYTILKADTASRFSYKQRLALFVASLCHDLDHRGYTNKYMSETASPLASMYTTSTLEHHHFGITVTILQQDGHNIFDRFTGDEYKDMLGLIKTCILATDLAAFFPNLAQLKVECKGNYDWSNNEHRKLAMALSMTAADLSAAAKPWNIQIETVKVIFQEFYDQGDKERKAGKKPIPMMDRDKPQEQPASQVGFMTSICLPCYGMLQYLLPETDKMLMMAVKNLEIWQAKASDIDQAKVARVHQALKEIYENDEYSPSKDSNETTTPGQICKLPFK